MNAASNEIDWETGGNIGSRGRNAAGASAGRLPRRGPLTRLAGLAQPRALGAAQRDMIGRRAATSGIVAAELPEHLQGDFRVWANSEVGRISKDRGLLDVASNAVDWETGSNIESVAAELPEHLQGDFETWATEEA